MACSFTFVHLLAAPSTAGRPARIASLGAELPVSWEALEPWLWEGSSCCSRAQEGQTLQLLEEAASTKASLGHLLLGAPLATHGLFPPAERQEESRLGHRSAQTENAAGGKIWVIFLLAAQPTAGHPAALPQDGPQLMPPWEDLPQDPQWGCREGVLEGAGGGRYN